jgi:hypothetical protein
MDAKNAFQYTQGIRAYRFSTNAKITALMLSSRYNWTKMACAWPSNRIIAADTGLSISAVVKAKKELIDAGFLRVQRQFNNSCKYTPILPENIGDIMESYTSGLRDYTYDSEEQTFAPENSLKDNIKEKRKEKRKEKLLDESSIEDSYSYSNIIKTREDINVSLETTEYPLAEFRANTAADEEFWAKMDPR